MSPESAVRDTDPRGAKALAEVYRLLREIARRERAASVEAGGES